jgi:hypothetical protein
MNTKKELQTLNKSTYLNDLKKSVKKYLGKIFNYLHLHNHHLVITVTKILLGDLWTGGHLLLTKALTDIISLWFTFIIITIIYICIRITCLQVIHLLWHNRHQSFTLT